MLLLNMSKVQLAVTLELRKHTFYDFLVRNSYVSNTQISVLPTTYQLSCQERLIISKAIKEYISTQRIPSIGKKSSW